jgi:hypothetical protein
MHFADIEKYVTPSKVTPKFSGVASGSKQHPTVVPESSEDDAKDSDELPLDGDSNDNDSGFGNEQDNGLSNNSHYLNDGQTVMCEGISITDPGGNPLTALAGLLADNPMSNLLEFTWAVTPPQPSFPSSDKHVFVVDVPLVW